MHRSESLFDLFQSDTLGPGDSLLDILGMTDGNVEIPVVEFPRGFWWHDDEVVQGLKTGYQSGFKRVVEGWRHPGEYCGGQLFREGVSTHVRGVAGELLDELMIDVW